MIPELKELIVKYQRYYDLRTIVGTMGFIRKDLLYLAEQERGYIIIGKDKIKIPVIPRV